MGGIARVPAHLADAAWANSDRPQLTTIGGVQHFVKAFDKSMSDEAYAVLPDRHDVSLPVHGEWYSDRDSPGLVFQCMGSRDWNSYWWNAYNRRA